MNRPYVLAALVAFVVLPACKSGNRSRFSENGTAPPPTGTLYDHRSDAGANHPGPLQRDGGAPPADEGPAPPDAAAPHDEIDNTLYWDAATRPTSDNVPHVDAGTPDR